MNVNVQLSVRPGLAGLVELCDLIDEPLHPHEKRIARAYFGAAREVAAILPRGNAKTTLAAKIALHHLLSVPGAMVTLGAASRDQARIAFERMRGFAQHPALDGMLTIRHLELRQEDGGGLLRVVPSDGPRVHGLSSTLYIGDEVWAWPAGGELLEAMQTGLIKRAYSKFLLISTAAAQLDSPLGRLRARALAQPTAKRTGSVVEARGDLHWLEWSVPTTSTWTICARASRRTRRRGSTSRVCAGSAPPSRRRRSLSFTPAAGASARARGCPRARGRRASASPISRTAKTCGSESTSAANAQR